jgi:uncharacterized protein GlcG (DUF336 family)
MRKRARLAAVTVLALTLIRCGGTSSPSLQPSPSVSSTPGSSTAQGSSGDPSSCCTTPSETLTACEVRQIVQTAAQAVDAATVIAVTDRQGDILAVFRKTGAPATAVGNFGEMCGEVCKPPACPATVDANELAVALARTASFFSNDTAPLSSRTVRFISGIHFPPGIAFTPNAALYGIENTNRGCPLNVTFLPDKKIPPASLINGQIPGLGIITGKADLCDSDPMAVNPGGVPLFKQGQVVGGVGVAGASADVAEYSAYAGATCSVPVCGATCTVPVCKIQFGPAPAAPGVVVINGIALPFVIQTTLPAGNNPGTSDGTFVVGPSDSPGPVPDRDLIQTSAGPRGGLSQEDVQSILDNVEATAKQTRAAIRLPLGSKTRMVIAVADLNGTIIGLRRMMDATVFSIDVAVAKARNVVYFSSQQRLASDLPEVPIGTAVTNRTISFGAQPLYPPGINGSQSGPFFQLYMMDTAKPCTQGFQPPNANQNGIVFFPGSEPLYKNGLLAGGLGVSGDGVDQDDYVTAGGAVGFEAPTSIRADQIIVRGVRLPYMKFPRNPTD